jgi:hypothetical protein
VAGKNSSTVSLPTLKNDVPVTVGAEYLDNKTMTRKKRKRNLDINQKRSGNNG